MEPVSAQQPAASREHPSPGDSVFRDSGARRVTTSFRAVGKVPAGRADRAAHLQHRPSRLGCGGPCSPGQGRQGRQSPARGLRRPPPPQQGRLTARGMDGSVLLGSPPRRPRAHARHPQGRRRRRRRRRRRKDAGHRARDLFTPPGSRAQRREEGAPHSPLPHHQRALDP